jgi:hypothetical protein
MSTAPPQPPPSGPPPGGPPPQAPVVIKSSGMGSTRKILGIIAGVVVLIVVAVIVIGALSGKTLDAAQVQQKIRTSYPTLRSVNCPDGVEVKTGKTFDCAVVLPDGSKATVTVREINSTPDVVATLHR